MHKQTIVHTNINVIHVILLWMKECHSRMVEMKSSAESVVVYRMGDMSTWMSNIQGPLSKIKLSVTPDGGVNASVEYWICIRRGFRRPTSYDYPAMTV